MASLVGGLYKFVAVSCLALSWLFGQPYRELNLALSYEKMSKVDGYFDNKTQPMARYKKKLSWSFHMKLLCLKRFSWLAKLLPKSIKNSWCCKACFVQERSRASKVGGFYAVYEYYDELLR